MYDWTIYDVRLDDLRCTIENAMPARKSNYRNRKTKQTSIVHRKSLNRK